MMRTTAIRHAGVMRPVDDAVEEVTLAQEVGDEARARLVVERAGRAALHELAVAQDGHLVRHGQRLFLIVGDVDEGHADPSMERLQLPAELGAELLVERRERLVEQEQVGLEDERAGQGDALLLTTGELPRRAVGEVGQVDEVERLAHPRRGLGPGDAADLERKADVVRHGQMREQGVTLKDHAEVAALRRQMGDHALVDEDVAGRRLDEPGDRHEDRRLAGPRRAQQREEIAAPDREGDVVDGAHPTVVLAETPDVERVGPLGQHGAGARVTRRSCRGTPDWPARSSCPTTRRRG